MPDKALKSKQVRVLFWCVALVLGGLHAWAAAKSNSMNPDGIAYLDIGDAYLRGDWNMAINRYWSPLYSWILGLVMHFLHPSIRWEFPVVHIINFLVYVFALICFEFFWVRLIRWHKARSSEDASATFPEWTWLALGYSLFLYSALNLIKIWSVTPDMLVAAIVFLAAGLIVRIRAGAATRRTFALLGTVLGVGYLAKAAMFPLAFIFLATSVFSVGDLRRATMLVPVALAFFLLIAGPYIAVLSFAKGGLTFGDTGKLMYAWHVNGVAHPHWQGEVLGAGTPIHPSRKVFESPAIYEFGRASGGTYPISYDPSYWYEGVTPHFELRGQVKVLLSSMEYYFDLFVRQQGGLIVCVLILYFLIREQRPLISHKLLQESGLAILALLSLGMFAFVHVQPRYIGAFVVLLWADIFARLNLPASWKSRRLLSYVGAIMLSVLLMNIVAFNLEGFRDLTGFGKVSQVTNSHHRAPPRWPGAVAEDLHRLGIRSGDKVAVIGYAFDSFWARLARVQIVAEILDGQADQFWLGEPSLQSRVFQAFGASAAKAIVAERVPNYVTPSGWHQVENSNYYIYVLAPQSPAQVEKIAIHHQ
jgi:hypothetical protein